MANIAKQFVRAAASLTSATLYTVPSGKTNIVTNISITNTTGTAITASVLFDDVAFLSGVTVSANDTLVMDTKTVLIQNKTINPTLINGKNYIPVKSAPENVVIKKTIQTPEDTKIHTIKIGDKTFIPTSVIPKEDRATF